MDGTVAPDSVPVFQIGPILPQPVGYVSNYGPNTPSPAPRPDADTLDSGKRSVPPHFRKFS
jgi:hypothetical protein